MGVREHGPVSHIYNMSLDPRIAYTLEGRELLRLTVNVPQSELREISEVFARYLTSANGRAAATWQEAWNAFTGATPNRAGIIAYTPLRCRECKGKRYSTRNVARNFARTGHAMACGECRGSGRGQYVRAVARYAFIPETEDES